MPYIFFLYAHFSQKNVCTCFFRKIFFLMWMYFWCIKIYSYSIFYVFLWITIHASWIHLMLFTLQNSIVASLWAPGCIHTFFIPNISTSSKTFSVTVGGVTKITTSIVFLTSERVGYTFSPKISFSFGLIGTTLYPASSKSLKTLYPCFSSLVDAPTTA